MMAHDSKDLYLETIYNLLNERDGVHAVDVAKELDYSKASVSRALKNLTALGYITIDEHNHIQLTPTGMQIAVDVILKHKLIKKMLIETLGMNEDDAERDACVIEHVVSDELFIALKSKY